MSSTRHASPGGPLRQERFSSSPEFERGLKANLVARRCKLLADPKARELIWWLQSVSHREGGLAALRDQIREKYEGNICTATMFKLGFNKPGQRYTAAQVEVIRSEMDRNRTVKFMTPGEQACEEIAQRAFLELIGGDGVDSRRWESIEDERRKAKRNSARAAFLAVKSIEDEGRKADERPEEYFARDFHKECCHPASLLDEYLANACLSPDVRLSDLEPWYFQNLRSVLITIKDAESAAVRERTISTEIGRQVENAFKLARKTRRLVIVNGNARIGKSFNARAWCDQYPGLARLAQVPATGDEIGFYRAIARALGVSIALNSKAQELRTRIEEVLQTGQLLLCLDEAHYLFPQTNYRDAQPQRVNWLMTELVNYGVPVVLVTTPQFFSQQKRIEQRTCWTSEQFIGRILRQFELPAVIPEDDLLAVARYHLPEAGKVELAAIVSYAQSSAKYLAAIDAISTVARYFAEEDGRAVVRRADIQRAMREGIIPSDRALASRLAAVNTSTRRGRRLAAAPLPSYGEAPADDLQPSDLDRPAPARGIEPAETINFRGRRGIVPAAVPVEA